MVLRINSVDGVEISPNSRAACKICGKLIHKDEVRVYIFNYNGYWGTGRPSYCHGRCKVTKLLDELLKIKQDANKLGRHVEV